MPPRRALSVGDWMRLSLLLAVAAILAGCTTAPPERLVFGVSGNRPAGSSGEAADAQMREFLDRKANQICTLGYEPVKAETLAAEQDQQIVDLELRCRPYSWRLF
jgi:hypothetical protein